MLANELVYYRQHVLYQLFKDDLLRVNMKLAALPHSFLCDLSFFQISSEYK